MKLYGTYLTATLVPLLRTPAYWIPLVVFPSLLYAFFGIPPSQQGQAEALGAITSHKSPAGA